MSQGRLVVDPSGHPLPLSRAAPGAMGETGTWRTQRPVVDAARCTGCYLCWLYCPEDVIEMRPVEAPRPKEVPVIDYRFCKGCGVCAAMCPVKAIRMVEEQAGGE